MFDLVEPGICNKPRGYDASGSGRIGMGLAAADNVVEHEDPDYRLVLENLYLSGNSYSLVVHRDDGEPLVLEYERYPLDADGPALETHANVENFAADRGKRRKTREAPGGGKPTISRGRGRKRKEEIGVEDVWDDLPLGRRRDFMEAKKARGGKGLGSERDSDTGKKKDHGDEEDLEYGKLLALHISNGDRSVRRKVGKANRRVVDQRLSDGSGFKAADRGYGVFLNRMEKKGGDKIIEAEEQSDSGSDSDLVILNEDDLEVDERCAAVVSTRPSQPIKVGSDFLEKRRSASRLQFKKELVEVLKKPYNSKEYRDLKCEVELRRPIAEDIDQRGKRVARRGRPKLNLGKSYLALYTDFAKLFELSKDNKRRSLNLLRGFFFWLKNISRDEAFRPWEDPKILKVLPQK